MKWLVTVLVACSLMLPFGIALADQTTAPGQQKKAADDGSAKTYAPGQDKDSEAGAKAAKHTDAKPKGDKAKHAKGSGDKAKGAKPKSVTDKAAHEPTKAKTKASTK